MFNFDRAPKAKPAPSEDPSNAEKLEQTDGRTMEALKSQLRDIAAEVGTSEDKISERDIDQAAFHIALRAEEQGTPLTYDHVMSASDEEKLEYIESMGLRLKARPEAGGGQMAA